MFFRILFLLLPLLLANCAQLPDIDYDIMRAQDSDDPTHHLDVLRAQSEAISGNRFMPGNKVTLLHDGAASYPSMLAAIGTAQKRIDVESYIFDDTEGDRFARALLKRRAAGADIYLIYDAWGSLETPVKVFDRLRKHGVHVLEYNPIDPGSVIDSSANHRDHRKLLIIDGKVAYTGGVNVSNVYTFKEKVKHLFHHEADTGDTEEETPDTDHMFWRDTQIKIEGPVVAEFEKLFMDTWEKQKGPVIPLPPPAPMAAKGDLQVEALDGTPDSGRYTIYRSLMVAIALARHSIHLTTAFFVPTPDLLDGLKQAAKRGVDVTLVLPSYSTSPYALSAGRGYYEDLMEAGVHIYERQNAVLHAKTAVIDGIWSTVGSSNLDWRSVLFNNECNAVILGSSFGKQMEDMFRGDIAHSKFIDPEEWKDRPLGEIFDEWKDQTMEYFL